LFGVNSTVEKKKEITNYVPIGYFFPKKAKGPSNTSIPRRPFLSSPPHTHTALNRTQKGLLWDKPISKKHVTSKKIN
jgi:hypothetical protein